eukprot:gene12969-3190_t
MLALVRYRRIAFRWLSMGGAEARGVAQPPGPRLAPFIVFADGKAMNDSTFLI